MLDRRLWLSGGKYTQRGGYILELVGVLFGITLLVVGGFDIARVMQARGALKTGVQEGLRCLYSSEGRCTGERVVNGYRERFDVYGRGPVSRPAMYRIRGGADWVLEPNSLVRRLSRSLQSLTYEAARNPYGRFEVRHHVTSHSVYLRALQGLPFLDGNDPLRPTFYVDSNRSASATPVTVRSPQTLEGFTDRTYGYRPGFGPLDALNYQREMSIGSVTFKVPTDGVISNYSELQSVLNDPVSASVDLRCVDGASRAPCRESVIKVGDGRDPARAMQVPFFLRIDGRDSPDSGDPEQAAKQFSPTATGTVYARLIADGTEYRLGGRMIARNSGASFITRNVHPNNMSPIFKDAFSSNYIGEFKLYTALVYATPGSDITVEFFLRSHARSEQVYWRLGSLEVFFPKLEFVNHTVDCGYQSTTCSCQKLNAEATSDFLKVGQQPPILAPINDATCLEQKPEDALESHEADKLLGDLRSGPPACNARTTVTTQDLNSPSCAPEIKTYGCSQGRNDPNDAPNGGIVASSYVGCPASDLDIPQDHAERQCGVPSSVAQRAKLVGMKYSETTTHAPEEAPACTREDVPSCATRDKAPGEREFVVWHGATPDQIRQCPSVVFPSPKPIVETSSPFQGNLCRSDETYRASFIADYIAKYKVPLEVPISTQIEKLDPGTIIFGNRQLDPCLEVTTEHLDDFTLLKSDTTKVATRTVCDTPGIECEIQTNLVPHTTGGSRAPRGDLAKAAAADAVMSFYPLARAASECDSGSADCLSVSVSDSNPAALQVRASMAVPLILPSLVGSDPLVVSYEESAVQEQALLGNR